MENVSIQEIIFNLCVFAYMLIVTASWIRCKLKIDELNKYVDHLRLNDRGVRGVNISYQKEIVDLKKKYEKKIEELKSEIEKRTQFKKSLYEMQEERIKRKELEKKQDGETKELKAGLKTMQEDFETALYEGFEVSNTVLDGIVQYLTLNRYFVNEKFEIIREPILLYKKYSPWPSDGYTIEKIVDRTKEKNFKTKVEAEEYVKTVAKNLGVK